MQVPAALGAVKEQIAKVRLIKNKKTRSPTAKSRGADFITF